MKELLINPIEVDCAGLVLLEPFLPQLFRHLEYSNGYQFVDEDSKVKAYSLLVNLSSKEKSQNSLVHALCNLDRATEISIINPEAHALIELDKMLEAVIGNWGSLRNISADLFVKYWINRIGTFEESEECYFLFVQRETGDILLDSIKWSYSLIKFPWMHKPIKVEW